jgi:hypothetical protein
VIRYWLLYGLIYAVSLLPPGWGLWLAMGSWRTGYWRWAVEHKREQGRRLEARQQARAELRAVIEEARAFGRGRAGQGGELSEVDE